MLLEKKEEVSILIYIGTNKVSASFVSFSKNKKPKVLLSVKVPFPSGVKVDESLLTQKMLSLLEESIVNVIKNTTKIPALKGKVNIKSVYINISSPWYISKIQNINIKQEKQFVITQKFLQNILEVEEKKFENELFSGDYEKKYGNDLFIIENTITSIKINGYKVKEALDKKTDNLTVSLYSSVMPESIFKKILSMVHKHTHLSDNEIHFNTFPLTFFNVLKEINEYANNYLLMDITGEVTDVTLVHDNYVSQNLSFPSARNFIIRQIAKDFDVSFEIAESILHIYNSKKADNEIIDNMTNVLGEVEKEWSIYFEDTFNQLSKNVILPPVIYIISDVDVYYIYEMFFKITKNDQTSLFRSHLNIININKDMLSKFCDFNTSLEFDEYLASLSIFVSRIK